MEYVMINGGDVGKFIAERRNAVGFTRERLAEHLNVSRQEVLKWERGVSLPDTGILLELSQALSVTVESVLLGAARPQREKSGVTSVPKASVSPINGSEDTVGYRVKIMHKPAFQIVGFTRIIPPHDESNLVGKFVSEVISTGKIDLLRSSSSNPPWILGLGSWDEECEPGGQRYTMGIEETDETDLRELDLRYKLHRQAFERCDWICFEVPQDRFDSGRFWVDNPYQMLSDLGYRFHRRVGVHFDAVPPRHDPEKNPGVEFWISVMRETDDCKVCRSRPLCAEIQPFSEQP
jgi:transcriptional regulator with XRE-family HTH domain